MNNTDLDNRPLTPQDLQDLRAATAILSRRVITHLGKDWRLVPYSEGLLLESVDGVRLTFDGYGFDIGDHEFMINSRTLTGRPSRREGVRMNLYALPANIAATIEADILPEERRYLEVQRKQAERVNRINDSRKAMIEAIASALEWKSTAYKCYAKDIDTHPRRRGTSPEPVARGTISYKNDGTMNVFFEGLSEELVTKIVHTIKFDSAIQSRKEET